MGTQALSAMHQKTNYESLRSWYLAKLRKSAIEAEVSGQLTPSALIAADREVVEKLIAERSESEVREQKPKSAVPSALPFALGLWAFLIVGMLASLFLFCLADPSILMDVLTVSVNPANLMASSSSVPNPLVLIAVQMILFVYPISVIPYVLLVKRDSA